MVICILRTTDNKMRIKGRNSLILLATLFLVDKIFSAELEVKVHYQPEVKGGKPITVTFGKSKGTPTCKLNGKNYGGNPIPEKSVIMDSAYKTITIQAAEIGSVDNDFMFVSSINCVDNSESISFELRIFILKEVPNDDATHKICLFETFISNLPQPIRTVEMLCYNLGGTCSVSVVDPTKASVDLTGSLYINDNTELIKVTQSNSADSALLKVDCTLINIQTSVNIPVFFHPGANPWAIASGDPHFEQIVFDGLHSMNMPICYDVLGTPDSYLKIVEYSKIGVEIYGHLKDDYYMHRIIIKSVIGNVTVSMNSISIHNKTQVNWIENSKRIIIQSKFFNYEIFSSEILITILQETPIIIKIEKARNFIDQWHLDVSFKSGPKDYVEMSGLLGHIGKKEYKFYSSVQSDSDISNSKKTTIGIGNNLIIARKVERNGKYCWLMAVDDILKPIHISNFFFQNIN
ncbi:DgyrCDS14610 [Dimorphilus gyrociliatus]|uniref:DgyrCDS14610 n=1 Tax=Dimorphilus gyrociliatus TaxID=2664684 RepID=A0A7I8WED2_9ANNE|nr:DgyrCDS14610 [Dimorphilus gyrociliatus]